jgi:hypothetical protein
MEELYILATFNPWKVLQYHCMAEKVCPRTNMDTVMKRKTLIHLAGIKIWPPRK